MEGGGEEGEAGGEEVGVYVEEGFMTGDHEDNEVLGEV